MSGYKINKKIPNSDADIDCASHNFSKIRFSWTKEIKVDTVGLNYSPGTRFRTKTDKMTPKLAANINPALVALGGLTGPGSVEL